MKAIQIPLPDLAATEALAKRLAPLAQRGDVIALAGPLGAGKTAFARAFIRALGVAGEVPSPTFTLLQTYEAKPCALYHFDLYRLKHANELEELGWDDARSHGIILVEWPERAGGRLPADRLALTFGMEATGMKGNVRFCSIEASGGWAQRLAHFTEAA